MKKPAGAAGSITPRLGFADQQQLIIATQQEARALVTASGAAA